MHHYDAPFLLTSTPSSIAFMSPSAANAESVRWTGTHVDDEVTVATAAPPSSSSSSSPPFLAPLLSFKAASSLSHTAASHRSVDPYEVCRCELDQFLELQDEQVELVRQLQDALRVGVSPLASASSADSHNAENVPPGPAQRLLLPSRRNSKARKGTTPGGGDQHSDGANVAPPSSIVHRLHVLQHESTELASTRCFPALKHLLSAFESYWSWKRTHMQCDNDVAESEGGGGGAQSRQGRSNQRLDVSMKESDSRGERKKDSFPLSAAEASASSLRARYDHVVRVRDELESFLQLHTEAVRALPPYLHQWTLPEMTTPQESRHTSSIPQFYLYVEELLEVTQTARHVARLLQTALTALCRPSPRRVQRSPRPPYHPRAGELSVDGVSKGDGRDEGVDFSTRPALSVHTGGQPFQSKSSSCSNGKEVSGSVARNHGRPSTSSPGTKQTKSPSPRTPSSQRAAAAQQESPSTAADDALVTPNDHSYLKDDNAWVGVLSPLTPPPPPNSSVPAHLAVGTDATPSSPDSSPPLPMSAPDQQDSLHRQRHRHHHHRCRAQDGEPVFLSATPTPTAALFDAAASPSPSPTATVSVSPMTAVRRGGPKDTTTADVEGCRDDGDGAGGGRSRAASLANASSYAKSSSTAASTPSPPLSWSARFVSAAVSPAPAARTLADGKRNAERRTTANGSGDTRSLLPELASAQGDEVEVEVVVEEGTALLHEQREPTNTFGRGSAKRSDMETAVAAAAAAVFFSSDGRRSASPRSPSISNAYTRAAEWSRSRSSVSMERSIPRGRSGVRAEEVEVEVGESAAGSVGRAASIPSFLWPQLAATAAAAEGGGGAGRQRTPSEQRSEAEEVSGNEKEQDDLFFTSNGESGTVLAPTSAPTGVDNGDFYTSSSKLQTEREAKPLSPSPEKAATAFPSRSASQPDIHADTPTTAPTKDTRVLHSGSSSDRVEVAALEKEAAEIQAMLQQQQPERTVKLHRPSRRSAPSRSSGVDSQTSSPSASSSSSSPSSERRPRSRSGHRSRRCQRRHRRRRGSSGSSTREENRHLESVLHRELATIRAEQRHSLEMMQRDMRRTLDEVVSLATTAASSSRASSCHSTDVEAEKAKLHRDEERDTHGDEGRTKLERSNGKLNIQSGIYTRTASPSDPLPSSAEAETEAAVLRESLAAAQARAERLEQRTIQLKKRLWLSEFSGDASGMNTDKRSAAAPSLEEEGGSHRGHLSLRDAFVFGSSRTPQRQRDASRERDAAAEEPLAEENALLYLVDRALAERRGKREGAVHVDDVYKKMSALQTTPLKAFSSSSPSLLTTTSQGVTMTATAEAINERTGIHASPSPLKCFDDVDDVPWHQRHTQTVLLPAGRSPRIRQQRASIFQRLRHSDDGVSTTLLSNDGAAAGPVPAVRKELSQLGGPTSDSNGEEGRRGEPALLHPPPPVRPLSSTNVDNANNPASSGAAAALRSSSTHPYSHSTDGAPPYLPPHDLRRAQPHPPVMGAASGSLYYASISNSHHAPSPPHRPEEISGTALRAEQVLKNARRLLQRRSDAHTRSRIIAEDGSSCQATGGAYAVPCQSAEAVEGEEGRAPLRPTASVPYLASPSWPIASEGDSLPFPPPPPYTAVMRASCAAPQPPVPPPTAAQSPPPHPHGGGTEQRRRPSLEHSPQHSMTMAFNMGKLQSPSSGAQYFGYDASPCSAVAYSSSKAPRAPPHPHHRRSDEGTINEGWPAVAETYRDGAAISSSPASHRAPSPSSERRPEERVDSATSPISSPVSSREQRRSAVKASSDARTHDGSRRAVSPSPSPSLSAADEHLRQLRSRTSLLQRDASTGQRSTRAAPYGATRDDRRAPSSSYSQYAEEEEKRHRDVPQNDFIHPRRRSNDRQIRWEGETTAASSRTASRNSSLSSRGSAQEELLDKLNRQESLLQHALAHLRTQQHQLCDKRSEVTRLAAAKRRSAGHGGAPAAREKGAARGTKASTVNGGSGGVSLSPQLEKLSELLQRLDAAKDKLAEKESRVQQAVRAIQRQRAALVSDDFL
ncbi:hypothetical protein ABB37_06414 [Leptomonas pyrrhocoris]|uniref:Uncharacterized protein n=1 Tax=Leptomonas pyrrhocoris TaxID=157538 RepID=A0A0M9FXZ4_LEPPY|nr:hypothetical protein ABB37_06414 [Leptomonas pyrrhocoris]KPA78263.1 hypothetical protein ABB37_06414 [Leptomonas pyrrhocoris]|eukprot:XP_015656702.1 hypothetical protein ABB37_06414 [Leptomonas pyrrhocoris]